MRNPLATAAAIALSLIATAASAEGGVRTEKNLSLDLATQIAAHTVATCSANGYHVTATVVDRSGTVRAVQRADNAGPHTLEASRLKAYTSASAKNTTLAIMEASQKNPAAANLGQIPGYLLLGGGVPVKVGNEVIGAVGVGGAPGGHLDEQCAVAAIAKVQDQIK
ncbi:GlcG/HbpS family heme-binding protein [Paracidovorax sp. MALMAid1276]|uniref:GlcG/HbpS family heme-binding protein n=1 Tax=Paracidovorax sp. MALMAid1276 TaxID=3411631 RepID=UPI003B9AFCA8